MEGLVQLCSSKTEGDVKGAWGEIARELPHRSLQACHNLIRRKFNPYNYKGAWTEDEEEELIDCVNKYGKEWKSIAGMLGRTPTNIRDKWRELGAENYLERRKDEWSIEETVELLKLIEVSSGISFLKRQLESHVATQVKLLAKHIVTKKDKPGSYFERENRLNCLKELLDAIKEDVEIPCRDLNWTAIAYRMKTRSVDDCRNKWEKQLYLMLASRKRFTPKRDLELALA